MARLNKDVRLNEEAFRTASGEMKNLKARTEKLRSELEKVYGGLSEALKSEAGDEFKTASDNVVLEPIDNLQLVINQMSDTLNTIIGTGYYKDIFIDFENLNKNL